MNKYLSVDFELKDALKYFVRVDDIFYRGEAIDSDRISKRLGIENLRIIWNYNDNRLNVLHPLAIIGRSEVLEGFLPRVLAQPGFVEPATSVIRAWNIEDLVRVPLESKNSWESFVTGGIIGLLIAELKVAGGKNLDISRCGLDVSRRTLTFTCGAAWMLGMKREDFSDLFQRWHEVYDLVGSDRDSKGLPKIEYTWDFLMFVADQVEPSWVMSPQELWRYIQLWQMSADDRRQNDYLFGDVFDVALNLLQLSREARYGKILELLQMGLSGGKSLSALESGYLISIIDPGSFDFFEFAADHGNKIKDFYGTFFAYSLFAGILGGKSSIEKFNSFGAYITFKGFNISSQLNVDISIHELRILQRLKSDSRIGFRSRNSSILDVEIFPNVTASFSYGAKKREGLTSRPIGMSDEDISNLDEAIHALNFATSVISQLKDVNLNIREMRRRK